MKTKLTIRVWEPPKNSAVNLAFVKAKGDIALMFPDLEIIYEGMTTSEIVKAGNTPETQIKWLTEGDGCIILTHIFESDYPVLWDYLEFLKQLSMAAKLKSIPIYPEPIQINNDAAFTQVCFLYSSICYKHYINVSFFKCRTSLGTLIFASKSASLHLQYREVKSPKTAPYQPS